MPLIIQGFNICETFYMLSIQGAKVVLGIQWLQILGLMTINYAKLTMDFFSNGSIVSQTGDTSNLANQISHSQLQRLVQTTSIISSFFNLMD